MEPELAKATVEHEKKIPELNKENGEQYLEKNTPDFSPASSISSSFSSSLSLGFGIDEKGPFEISKSDGDPLSCPESISSPDSTSNQTPPWSMLSTSPPPETGDPHLLPVQTSDQPAGYDPNRIPASIFSIKATNPSEWSAASNESLFSIQMGNNSFSQDNAIMFGKSGELGRVDEWNNGSQSGFGNVSESKVKVNESSGLPTVIEVSAHEESSLASGEDSRVSSFNNLNVISGMSMENRAKEKMPDFERAPPAENNLINSSSTPRTSASNPRLSDESGNSGSSFAFPVLVSDVVKTGSLRRVTDIPEKPQLQAQVSKETRKAPERRWFCRLCCWPRCC